MTNATLSSPASTGMLHAAIDIGTTSIKCIANSGVSPARTELIGSLPTAISIKEGGVAEVDPRAVLAVCLTLLEKLVSYANTQQQTLATVGLTGFIGSAICIDRQGNPLPPCAIWQDQRCLPQSEDFFSAPPERLLNIHGISVPPGVCWPGPKIRWLRDHHPDVLEKTWKILQIKDYVFYHLTGLAHSEARTFMGLANIIENRFDPVAIDWCGIRPDQLPELRRADEAFPLDPRWRQELQINTQPLPMIGIGTADMTAAFLGCLLQKHEAALLANTAEIIGFAISHDDPTPTAQAVVRVPYRDELDLIYGSTTNGGACINWFSQVFGPGDLQQLSSKAALIPPGADGVIFLPYLTGERAPLWNSAATGVFAGLKASHTKAHLYRAVLEGCAFSKRHVLQSARAQSYGQLKNVKICGGSSHVHLWNQIRASVFNLPLQVDEFPESSAVGALWLAAVQLDPHRMTHFQQHRQMKTVSPLDGWVDVYDKAYADYLDLISNTQPQRKDHER